MNSTEKNGFHLVYDMKMLTKVVNFLQSGFSWDEKRTKDILAYFSRLDITTPKAAFFSENEEIKIAILLFNQTDEKNSSEKIINISAWYAKDTHRGIDAIRFAKNLTSKLSDFTITNYTPSVAVKKILTSMGYEYMNVQVDSLGLQKKFPFIKLQVKRKHFSFRGKRVEPNKLGSNQNIAMARAAFQFSIARKMGINLKTLNIFLRKGEGHISFLWLIKYLLFHGVVRVKIYYEIDTIPSESPWLIKNIQSERYIFPHKSELSI